MMICEGGLAYLTRLTDHGEEVMFMAFISRECLTCTEGTKRYAGGFSGRDEQGKPFSGKMYLCDNMVCKINLVRLRSQKELRYLGH